MRITLEKGQRRRFFTGNVFGVDGWKDVNVRRYK